MRNFSKTEYPHINQAINSINWISETANLSADEAVGFNVLVNNLFDKLVPLLVQ